jgi:hypothetical protein
MEALGAGCLTYVGPKHVNNREALEFKNLKLGPREGLTVVQNAADWSQDLEAVLADPAALKTHSENLKAEFQKRLGASRALLEKLNL